MHYIKHIGISVLLLAVPAALLADGDAAPAADKTYWETVKETPGNYPKSTVLAAVAVTAAGVYAAHTYSTWFREKVSRPALEKFEAYRKNLEEGDTKTLVFTGAAVTALSGTLYGAHTYSKSFREKVSGSALEKVKAYGKNLSEGDTNTLVATGVAVIALSGSLYGAHKKWDILGKLKITAPKASAEEAALIETIKRHQQLERQILQQLQQDDQPFPSRQLLQYEEVRSQILRQWEQFEEVRSQILRQWRQSRA